MSEYRVPGRDIDMTEIEREKIRQAEETKRATIKQREETKRKEIDDPGYVVTRLAVAGVVVAAIISACNVGQLYVEAHAPKDARCVESSEIRNISNGAFKCPGGHVSAQPIGTDGQVLIKCLCDSPHTVAADGGIP